MYSVLLASFPFGWGLGDGLGQLNELSGCHGSWAHGLGSVSSAVQHDAVDRVPYSSRAWYGVRLNT